MSRWVVDASPLIFLAKLDRLSLLQRAADEILAPSVVLEEIHAQNDPAVSLIDRACADWLRPASSPRNEPKPPLGELAVIELGLEYGADRIVLDDLAARRQARKKGLSVIGTLGILLAARLRGDVTSLSSEIQELARHGFRASDQLVTRVLSEAGER